MYRNFNKHYINKLYYSTSHLLPTESQNLCLVQRCDIKKSMTCILHIKLKQPNYYTLLSTIKLLVLLSVIRQSNAYLFFCIHDHGIEIVIDSGTRTCLPPGPLHFASSRQRCKIKHDWELDVVFFRFNANMQPMHNDGNFISRMRTIL